MSDIFLVLQSNNGSFGLPKGETVDQVTAKNAIELDAASFGAMNPVSIGSSTSGAGSGKVKFGQLVVTKNVDAASPKLFQALAAGEHFQTATIVVRRSGNAKTFLQYSFGLVFVTALNDRLTPSGAKETITFAYGSEQFKYTPQNPNGTTGKTVTGQWNQVTNQPTSVISRR